MTLAELLDILQKYPPETVVYKQCSDGQPAVLKADEVRTMRQMEHDLTGTLRAAYDILVIG